MPTRMTRHDHLRAPRAGSRPPVPQNSAHAADHRNHVADAKRMAVDRRRRPAALPPRRARAESEAARRSARSRRATTKSAAPTNATSSDARVAQLMRAPPDGQQAFRRAVRRSSGPARRTRWLTNHVPTVMRLIEQEQRNGRRRPHARVATRGATTARRDAPSPATTRTKAAGSATAITGQAS